MSINLFIARHGNTFEENQISVLIGKKTDLPLVEKGKQQAIDLGKHFKQHNIKFDAIFSGRLKRQFEFAQLLSLQLDRAPKITISEAFDELDYGSWEGQTTSSIVQNNEIKYDAWIKKGIWPDVFGEYESARVELLLNWITCLSNIYEDGQNILAVTSNGIIRQFARFSDSPKSLWSKLSESASIEQLRVSTGSYSKLVITPLGADIDLKYWNIKP